jgi:hypothetical protein
LALRPAERRQTLPGADAAEAFAEFIAAYGDVGPDSDGNELVILGIRRI